MSIKNSLRADDIESALFFITEMSQDNYEVILQAWQPYFEQVVSGMGEMGLDYQTETTVFYEMLHDEGGGVISAYPVYFIRDMDGNWKIDRF